MVIVTTIVPIALPGGTVVSQQATVGVGGYAPIHPTDSPTDRVMIAGVSSAETAKGRAAKSVAAMRTATTIEIIFFIIIIPVLSKNTAHPPLRRGGCA